MAGKELHVITNGKCTWTEIGQTAVQIHPFVTAIHIREKAKSPDEVFIGVQHLLALGVPAVKLYVNGLPAVAEALRLGGLHLPGSSPPSQEMARTVVLRIGFSVHSAEEAALREAEGADYVLFGHIYETASKPGLAARGLEKLAETGARVRIPVLAIGGMTPSRVPEVLATGAAGIAVMSGIWEAEDPLATIQTFHQALEHKGVMP
ncbi:thiamine phosphate synthase [Paenibacillus whitsoniae]|uniref:Thiazole tautomerase TenI n=1 Tax=Paenibacillus whitsoniae TaxID=2496558 RepID=A0A430J466_9BACL|nr:thiamine phosphate synthase [Paenibacillus whitsoniae]RTE01755.1 thiazole tautomerase TenI [Paenibacillus whitsoniae]